tara:strand:- start:210 stop:509 length:300 start_codon:yes stop_codon:yes gene_type:complete
MSNGGGGEIRSWFISDRSGFRFKYRDRIVEDTGAVVGPGESDGEFTLKSHPQNKSPRISGFITLSDARPEEILSVKSDPWNPSMTTAIQTSVTMFTPSS